MGCSQWCREEFKPSNFGFGLHHRPELTVTSEWHCFPPILYVIWRWFALLYHLAWIIVSVAASNIYTVGRATWLIYLTNWSYFLLTADVLVEAIASLIWYLRNRNPNNHPPETTTWYMKLAWFMYSMATASVILVGLAFWIILYTPGALEEFYIDVQTHGITLLYVVVNIAITGMPVRIYHVIYPILFSIIYVIFTVIYYYAGGVNKDGNAYIYKGTLDWADPKTSLTWISILVLVGVPVIHLLLVYGLHLIRVTVNRKCCKNNDIGDSGDRTEMSSAPSMQHKTYQSA